MYIRQTPILEDAMWMKSSLHPYEKNKNRNYDTNIFDYCSAAVGS